MHESDSITRLKMQALVQPDAEFRVRPCAFETILQQGSNGWGTLEHGYLAAQPCENHRITAQSSGGIEYAQRAIAM